MGRTKNIDKKNKILITAFHLFLKNGYNNTSYQAIADEIGFQKNLIQYYFSKKELLVTEFFEKYSMHTIKYLEQQSQLTNNEYINLYIIGQIHFSFLTIINKKSSFAIDIVSNRLITLEIINFHENWGLNYQKIEDEKLRSRLSDSIVMFLGGVYELIYRNLIQERKLDIPQLLETALLGYLNSINSKNALININLKDYAYTSQEIELANQSIIRALERDLSK